MIDLNRRNVIWEFKFENSEYPKINGETKELYYFKEVDESNKH